MKKQFYILSFMTVMTMSNVFGFDELAMFDETSQASKWQRIEWQFITNIKKSHKNIWKHISGVALGAVVVGALYQWNNTTMPGFDDKEDIMTNLRKPSNIWPIVTVGAAAIVSMQYFESYLAHQANRNAVVSFFDNWQENQFYTPKELEDGFDVIAEMIELQGQQAVLEHADEIVEMIQFFVTRHFESRYKSTLEAKSRDLLYDTKLVAETFKNYFDGASKFKQN